MNQTTMLRTALARAERFAHDALHVTRTAPRRSYAELSRRLDDAEVVLDLLARADTFASLARIAADPEDAVERAETAEALAREAWDEAARRAAQAA